MPRTRPSNQTVNSNDATNNVRSRRQQRTSNNETKQTKAENSNELNVSIDEAIDEQPSASNNSNNKNKTDSTIHENKNVNEDSNTDTEAENQNENNDTSNIQNQDNNVEDEEDSKMNVDKKNVEDPKKEVKRKGRPASKTNLANAAKANIKLTNDAHPRTMLTPKKTPRVARVTKGRSVEFAIKDERVIGWIKDQKKDKILIRWHQMENNNVHFKEQWFSKNDKALHIFDRRFDAHLKAKK